MRATEPTVPDADTAQRDSPDKSAGSILTHQDACKLVAFLLASAEISTEEPYYYATLRMIDAAKQLLEHINAADPSYQELQVLQGEISSKMHWMMWDRPAYFSFIKNLPPLMVDHLRNYCMSLGAES